MIGLTVLTVLIFPIALIVLIVWMVYEGEGQGGGDNRAVAELGLANIWPFIRKLLSKLIADHGK